MEEPETAKGPRDEDSPDAQSKTVDKGEGATLPAVQPTGQSPESVGTAGSQVGDSPEQSATAETPTPAAPPQPPSLPPPAPSDAAESAPQRAESGLTTLLLTLLVVWGLLYAFGNLFNRILEPRLADGFRAVQQTSEHLNVIAAVIGLAGTLLQAGIIVMAPILSLTLHESYDALFHFVETTLASRVQAERALAEEALDRLRRYIFWYRVLNPFFYGFWIFACVYIVIVALRLVLQPWVGPDVVHEALGYFIVSLFLTVAFAFVGLSFFLVIRPGIVKLELYTRLFTLRRRSHA